MSDVLEVDPVAEFLAREQNQLAGLEDEFQTSQTFLQKSAMSSNEDSIRSSLTTVEHNEATGDHNDLKSLSNSHSVDLNGYSTNNISASNTSNDTKILQLNGSLAAVKIHEEPEKIRKWREEQTLRLKKKDEDEKNLQAEWREAAKKELNDWRKMHDETIAKTKSANRNAEKQYIEQLGELDTGSEWEKVTKLCDFSSKTTKSNKDVSRMRTLILQLKQPTNNISASTAPTPTPITNSKSSVQKNSASTFPLNN